MNMSVTNSNTHKQLIREVSSNIPDPMIPRNNRKKQNISNYWIKQNGIGTSHTQ